MRQGSKQMYCLWFYKTDTIQGVGNLFDSRCPDKLKELFGNIVKIFNNLEFNRMEFAGSLGDLGTLLPLSLGMIMINQLEPVGVFVGIGIFYILSGLYFRVTCPVEPMKVISGYAIATGIGATTIQASALWLFIVLLLIGSTGLINLISRYTAISVVRGVQLSTGILLMTQGVKLIAGTSSLQQIYDMAEPYLHVQNIGPLPIGIVLGSVLGVLALLMISNKRIPAALIIVGTGIATGIVLGTHEGWELVKMDFSLPPVFPYGLPTADQFFFALMVLILPQVPMTVGNAVIANADLSSQYFPQTGRRVTKKSLCLSMAFANLGSFLIGGIPMCHGAGGLASRYRFGARTGGSNIIIGTIFLATVLLFGEHILTFIKLLPLSVLGVLLFFAGIQLALTINDVTLRTDLFVVLLIAGITIASNLAVAFVVGIVVAALQKWRKIAV